MTIFEFAIAREANALIQEGAERELTEKELRLLDALLPTLRRLERNERLGWSDAR